MNYSNYRISLDIHDISSQVSLNAKKGDTSRKILITLMENGLPYRISSECSAVFTAKKPDGNILYNACTIEDCTIIYALTPQTTSVDGKIECEIRLYGADNALITSPRFTIVVDATVYNDGDVVESTSEASALTALVSEATTLIDNVETKLANGEFKGEKGDKGDDASVTASNIVAALGYVPANSSHNHSYIVANGGEKVFFGTKVSDSGVTGTVGGAVTNDLYINISTWKVYTLMSTGVWVSTKSL